MKTSRNLIRRPWVTFALAIGMIVVAVRASYSARSDASYPSWITWIALVLILYAPVYALVLAPRLVKDEALLPFIQWGGGLSSFLLAWGVWFVFGGPVWLLLIGVITTAVTLAVVATISSQE